MQVTARFIPSPMNRRNLRAPVLRHPQILSSYALEAGLIPFSEVLTMNRRKFLDATFKTLSVASCSPIFAGALAAPAPRQTASSAPSRNANAPRPQLAITMDDPTLKLDSNLRWPDANSRILKALDSRNIRAALFVCGMRVDEYEGSKLLSAWDQAGHMICNHSYSHLNYCGPTSYADFAVDFLKNEKIIAPYHNRTLLFRYPFLKEGDTADKRDRFRALLK